MKKQFVLGVAAEIITPPVGSLLYGYIPRPSTSVSDDLRANAVAFGHGKPTSLLIEYDLCSITVELANRIHELIENETGISKDSIMLSAIHTHSGPILNTTAGWGETNNEYIEDILIPQTLKAAKRAIENVTPAEMGIGTTKSDVGMNRREEKLDGDVILGQNPWGPYDPTMTVIAFRDMEKKPLLNIVHYGAHATAAGQNSEITRDWPGVMVDIMERVTGAVTIFINGCMGDVGPRLPNGRTTGDITLPSGKYLGNIAYAKELGGKAGADAMRAYENINEYREVSFQSVSDTVTIPYRPLKTEAEYEKTLEELGDPSLLKSLRLLTYTTTKERIEYLRSGKAPETHSVDRQVQFAFNSIVLVPFPYEMFTDTTMRMRKFSPFTHTLCISNCNGAYAYLPSRDQLCRGGYEVGQFEERCVFSLVPNADDYIIKENLRIMEKFEK